MAAATTDFGTVLIVDDDRDTRVAASELLAQAGYRPITARNGLEALHLLRQGERPVVILVDMYMPLMDGEAFCDTCDAIPEFASIPRIIVSANHHARPHIRRWRARSFLDKPVAGDRVLEAVRSATAPAQPA